MHFPIIRLEKPETEKQDFTEHLPYDDYTLLSHTDYFGKVYNATERQHVIRSAWLADLFKGIAILDTEAETITFLDDKTVTATFKDYLKELTESLAEKAEKGTLSGYELKMAGKEYKDCGILFCLPEDYVQTTMDFIDDARYMAGRTYKIGNIFDAHI